MNETTWWKDIVGLCSEQSNGDGFCNAITRRIGMGPWLAFGWIPGSGVTHWLLSLLDYSSYPLNNKVFWRIWVLGITMYEDGNLLGGGP